jgi:hypothetical protein
VASTLSLIKFVWLGVLSLPLYHLSAQPNQFNHTEHTGSTIVQNIRTFNHYTEKPKPYIFEQGDSNKPKSELESAFWTTDKSHTALTDKTVLHAYNHTTHRLHPNSRCKEIFMSSHCAQSYIHYKYDISLHEMMQA